MGHQNMEGSKDLATDLLAVSYHFSFSWDGIWIPLNNSNNLLRAEQKKFCCLLQEKYLHLLYPRERGHTLPWKDDSEQKKSQLGNSLIYVFLETHWENPAPGNGCAEAERSHLTFGLSLLHNLQKQPSEAFKRQK